MYLRAAVSPGGGELRHTRLHEHPDEQHGERVAKPSPRQATSGRRWGATGSAGGAGTVKARALWALRAWRLGPSATAAGLRRAGRGRRVGGHCWFAVDRSDAARRRGSSWSSLVRGGDCRGARRRAPDRARRLPSMADDRIQRRLRPIVVSRAGWVGLRGHAPGAPADDRGLGPGDALVVRAAPSDDDHLLDCLSSLTSRPARSRLDPVWPRSRSCPCRAPRGSSDSVGGGGHRLAAVTAAEVSLPAWHMTGPQPASGDGAAAADRRC